MRNVYSYFFIMLFALDVYAGDDSSGSIKYQLDLAAPFETYVITESNKIWAQQLASRFKYKGKISYFVRTSLPLEVDDKTVSGAVYQRQDLPNCFYVAPGDYVLLLGSRWAASPGVGGFTLNAPKSKDFLACMNCSCGGVPALSSSPVVKGLIKWSGHGYSRL